MLRCANKKAARTGKLVHGTGYDPTRHQKTWRTAWRSLRNKAAKRAAAGIENEAARKKPRCPLSAYASMNLRHTAITKFAKSETRDQTIMRIAGHLDRGMLEHYSHIRNAAKRKAVDAIRSYIPEEPTSAASTRIQWKNPKCH